MSMSETIGMVVKLFLLLTPFFILSIFVSVTAEFTHARRRMLALRTTFAVLMTTVVLYLFGEWIFRCLGISLDAFRIGAGLVLLLNGIELVRDSGGTITSIRKCDSDASDIAVVPLAIPYTVGPGTIGTLLVMGAGVESARERITIVSAITMAVLLLGCVLYFSDVVSQLLKAKGLNILSKLTGMYLVALAAQIIFTGIRNLLF